MRVLLFGTYDSSAHPRAAIIAAGLGARGFDVAECNAPLGLDTAARVDMLARPWTAPLLLLRLARRWATLAAAARRMPRPDVVLVGYLGQRTALQHFKPVGRQRPDQPPEAITLRLAADQH